MKPREIAAAVLEPHGGGGEFVAKRLDNALLNSHLSPQDRRLAQELVFGVWRWRRVLDWLIERKTAGRPQKPFLQRLLQLGLYQVFWLDRIPNHAAVNEAVELAKKRGFASQAGFVNAVLRAYSREQAATGQLLAQLRETEPDLGYSHPEWLYRRWERQWGRDTAIRFMDWNNSPPPTCARLNALRASREELEAAWIAEGVLAAPLSFDWASGESLFRLESHPSLADLPSFRRGFFYVQDPSTVLAAKRLAARPQESVLDACSAPGGKAAQIAQDMRNEGRVVAEDADPTRLALVSENAERLGLRCLEVGSKEQDTFDRILVDAPCSNTGVMRRRVELRWRLRPEDISRQAQEQERILNACAPRLRSGGTLVYSTCSLEPEENGAVVARFLERHPSFRLDAERQLTPWQDGVDGAYVATLVHRGAASNLPQSPVPPATNSPLGEK